MVDELLHACVESGWFARADLPMQRLSILIADRTPEYCALIARWLRCHDTTWVNSTTEALGATGLLHFDVVISATTSDDPSGVEAIRVLKRRQPWARLLAVVPETEADRVRREFSRAIRAGADAVVRRRVEEREFLLALRACWHDVTATHGSLSSSPNFTLSPV